MSGKPTNLFLGAERKIVLYVPDWSVAALSSTVPPGAPAATVVKNTIHECTRTAKVFGVRPGMRQLTAQHICPDLLILPHDPIRDASEFETPLQVFDELLVGVNAIQPGLAWAPLHSSRWQRSEMELAEELLERIAEETGIEAYAGTGDGAAVATAAARRGTLLPRKQAATFLAQLALPEIVEFLPPAHRADFADALQLLRLLGVKRVEDLWELGYSQLNTRLGAIGQQLWTLATGGDLYVPTSQPEDKQVTIRHTFQEGVAGVERALADSQQAAYQLSRLLNAKGYGSQSLTVRLEFSDGSESSRRWTFFDVSESTHVAQRIIWQIRGWQNHLQGAGEVKETELYLTAVVLEAQDLVEEATTGKLWGAKPHSKQVNQTVAQIQTLLGEESVKQPRVQGGMDPRGRIKLQVWGVSEQLRPREGEWAGAVQESPLLLFDDPPLAKLMGQHPGGTWGQLWVDARGILTGNPSRLAILEDREELAGGGHEATGVAGLWVVKGRWWLRQNELEPTRCYLRLQVRGLPDFLLVQKGQEWRVEGVYVQQSVSDKPPFSQRSQ